MADFLQSLEQEVDCLQDTTEYRVDPRQEFRMVETAKKLRQLLTIIEGRKNEVQGQVSLGFSYKEVQSQEGSNACLSEKDWPD